VSVLHHTPYVMAFRNAMENKDLQTVIANVSPMDDKPKSVGGQPGNQNAAGHGAPPGNRNRTLMGVRGWAAIGSYPKGCSHVRRLVGRMRVELEDAVCEQHGSIGVYQAALVQSACRHEGRALLLTRWLRTETDGSRKCSADATDKPAGLTVAEKLGILKEIGNATDSRDRCLKLLGLDAAKDRNPWDALDGRAINGAGPSLGSSGKGHSPQPQATEDSHG
jgi:hypothetical protein